MTRRDGSDMYAPADLHKQGFSIFCSDYAYCPSFHGFMFDATKPVGTGEKVYNSSGPVYIVGVAGIYNKSYDGGSWTDNTGWDSQLSNALFQGIVNAITESPDSPEEYFYNELGEEIISLEGYGDAVELKRVYDTDGNPVVSIMQHYNMWIYEGYDTGAVYSEPLPPGDGRIDVPITDPGYIVSVEERATRYNPLIIHHGTQASQNTHFFINDMHTKSMRGGKLSKKEIQAIEELDNDREAQEKLVSFYVESMRKTLDQASVVTKHDANVAIRIIDGAIDYSLNEATNIGAYLQRLEFTDNNIVTMNENVQGAESTIRDADMAKEMTEYTKTNVLQQAAQSMLAQANQNASSVLSLLQ